MWAGSSASAASAATEVRGSSSHVSFGPSGDSSTSTATTVAPSAYQQQNLEQATAMPYPWDHHHLRHHEEVAVR